jgi:hypothetical protein
MLPLAVARSLRRSRAAPLVAARARTLASVADNLDLNLPAKFGHFIGVSAHTCSFGRVASCHAR